MSLLKRLFWPEPDPVTHETVQPAPGLPDKEREMRSVLYDISETAIRSMNRSALIRERLAEESIRIVAGSS